MTLRRLLIAVAVLAAVIIVSGYLQAIAPFAKLTPRTATYVVLGNHDHWRNGSEAYTAIKQQEMVPLVNSAARCGDVTIACVDDVHTGNDDLPRTKAAMAALGGTPVLLSHSPDIFPDDTQTGLTLAGHTHCGQIKLPLIGAPAIPSRYGKRFECGIIRENGRTMVVTSGIGTSIVPLRWFVPPDFWVITIGH